MITLLQYCLLSRCIFFVLLTYLIHQPSTGGSGGPFHIIHHHVGVELHRPSINPTDSLTQSRKDVNTVG